MSQEEEKIEQLEVTDEQIQALYMFLSLNWESLTDDEKQYWRIIMEKIDPEFNDEE